MASTTPVEAANSLVSRSYIRIVDVLGEGPLQGFVQQPGPYGYDPLTSILYDNVQVRNPNDGSYNFNVSGQGYAVFYALGTTGQSPMSGFENVENIIPLTSNTQITNPPPGAGNVKVVTATFNTTSYPDADSIKVTMNVPALYTEDTNGNVNGFVVKYNVDISLNGSAFENLDQITINGKCTSPYLFTTIYTLPKTNPPASFYQWVVKIYKTDVDILSTYTQNTIFVNSIGVVSASSFNYPNTALVGTFIAADQFSTIPNRAYLINGLQISVPNGYTPTNYSNPTFTGVVNISANGTGASQNIGMQQQGYSTMNGIYVGQSVTGAYFAPNTTVSFVNNGTPAPQFVFGVSTPPIGVPPGDGLTTAYFSGVNTTCTPAIYPNVWTGDFKTGVWTNNPAWIFYDILTNPRYGLGSYIQPALVDKWSLYQIAQYCDTFVDNGQNNGGQEPRFTCNVNITSADDAYNVLLNLASVFRGMVYYQNGSIYTSQTADKTPIYAYTNANVIKGQFNYTDSARNTRSTVALVRYNDPNNFYRQNTAYVQDTAGFLRYGYIEKQAAAFACTSIGQATRLGQWILTAEQTLTEAISFQVGLEGLFIRPGDVFNVYYNFRNNQNQGGRIVTFDTGRKNIVLDRPVVIGAGYNYTLSAIIPALYLDGSGSVTGSDEIALIRNSQIQTIPVTTNPTSGTTVLALASGFPTGLYKGSPFILSTTGGGTIFTNAAIYQCLSTTESAPGIIDVTALQFNTGIFALVEQNYNLVTNPPNSGNPTPILPPTNFTGVLVTGLLSGSNLFYQYLSLTWNPTPSTNLGYYVISGNEGGSSYVELDNTLGTFYNYFNDVTGSVGFTLNAVSKGGVFSSGLSTTFNFPTVPGVDSNQIRFWELPDGYGDLQQIGVFYNRPTATVSNTKVFFASGSGTPFYEVLDQDFYPALGVMASGITSSSSTAYFNSVSWDMPTMVSQAAIDQSADTLLLLVENELMSVGTITGLPNSLYAVSVLRGQLGTTAATHTSNVSGWMYYNADLNSFSDPSLFHVLDKTGAYNATTGTRYFQIQNLTQNLVGAVVPTGSPWLPYVLPNPLPLAPSSLTANTPGGPIVNLSWIPSTSLDVLQYQIWRTSGAATSLIGYESVNTGYADLNVSVGFQYSYYVLTEANNEETSSLSNTVTVTVPTFPTGANLTPPGNSTAPSLYSSGYYNANDGSVLIDFTFTIPALPAGAVGQELQYGLTTSSTLMTSNTIVNSGYSTRATVNDLTPGQTYVVALQAYSPYGIVSSTVTGVGSPYLVPSKSVFTRATAPTSVQIGYAQKGMIPIVPPAYYTNGVSYIMGAVTGSWTASTDNDIAFYEWYINSATPSDGQAINPNQTLPANQNIVISYSVPSFTSVFLWIRAINKSEGTSTWTQSASFASYGVTNYAGNVGGQDFNALQIQDTQIGQVSQSSVATLVAALPITFTYITAGGSNTENFTYGIANRGFTAVPTSAIFSVNDPNITCFYNVYSPGTYPNVGLTLQTVNLAPIAASETLIINAHFFQ